MTAGGSPVVRGLDLDCIKLQTFSLGWWILKGSFTGFILTDSSGWQDFPGVSPADWRWALGVSLALALAAAFRTGTIAAYRHIALSSLQDLGIQAGRYKAGTQIQTLNVFLLVEGYPGTTDCWMRTSVTQILRQGLSASAVF
jgi:hypothetical protein